MSYQIKPKQRANAKRLGVIIKTSTNSKKKIDVYKNDKKIASIGAKGYSDYATYIKDKGKEYADKRRAAYRARHKGEQLKIGSPGYYAWFILW
mgnify:FL=1